MNQLEEMRVKCQELFALFGAGYQDVKIDTDLEKGTAMVTIGDVAFGRVRLSANKRHLVFFSDCFRCRVAFPLYRKQGRIAVTIEEYQGRLPLHRCAWSRSSSRLLAELESHEMWLGGDYRMIEQTPIK